MSGEEFRKARTIGAQITCYDPITNISENIRVDEDTFKEILEDIRVLSRALPSDKLMLIMGIKEQLGKKVGCTGEGTTDIDSLLEADIGIAMGSGCSAARLESDMVLLDDNFASTIDAIKWGRNINVNVSRFL